MKKTDEKLKQGMWNMTKRFFTKSHDSISIVNNIFYCELDGNFAHDRCKEQCNHCKEEFDSWKD